LQNVNFRSPSRRFLTHGRPPFCPLSHAFPPQVVERYEKVESLRKDLRQKELKEQKYKVEGAEAGAAAGAGAGAAAAGGAGAAAEGAPGVDDEDKLDDAEVCDILTRSYNLHLKLSTTLRFHPRAVRCFSPDATAPPPS
jgi:hypothetical protein